MMCPASLFLWQRLVVSSAAVVAGRWLAGIGFEGSLGFATVDVSRLEEPRVVTLTQ